MSTEQKENARIDTRGRRGGREEDERKTPRAEVVDWAASNGRRVKEGTRE
jgi:hypothetical protein